MRPQRTAFRGVYRIPNDLLNRKRITPLPLIREVFCPVSLDQTPAKKIKKIKKMKEKKKENKFRRND
jgi:hypothetical protein